MTKVPHILLFSILAVVLSTHGIMIQENKSERKDHSSVWKLSDLIGKTAEGIHIRGNPGIVKYKDEDAVSFNGLTDAIFLENMPLKALEQFTIEVIIRPASGGNFEQRFLHFGEVQGDRVLLELRSTMTDWYLDAFIKVGDKELVLIDPGLLHPLDQWVHLAYVIDHGKPETYVNRKKELAGTIEMTPLKVGKTSIGVRQNEVSWFKGAIYKIRISPRALKPQDFMDL
jgi:hypothetical protein